MDQQDPAARTPAPAPQPAPVGPDYWKESKNTRAIYIAVALALVIAGAAYYFLVKSKPASKKPPAQNSQVQSGALSIDSKTNHYDSQNFALGFNYPANWSVVDTTGTGKLTVASPALQLKNAAGQAVTGQIVMTIRGQSQKLAEFNSGNATATRDSQKIAYTMPTQTQRGSTYLSFLQYATSNGGLDGVYITGDNGYQKGQAVPLVDVSKEDPVISITFFSCRDSKCTNPKPLSVQESLWDNPVFAGPVTTMLQSLSIT